MSDEYRTLDPFARKDLEKVDEVVAVGLPDPVAELRLREALGLAVAASVPGEDPVVVLPAPDGVRPAAAGVGETVQEEQRGSARVGAAEPVEAQVLTGVGGWHT